MILVIGGAYQGKQEYAKEQFLLSAEDWADGACCTLEELEQARAVHHFHVFIRRQLERGESVQELAERMWETNPGLIVVSDEVGYGVVPVDAGERAWREACGRVCTKLAQHAEQVIRVCCGIGTRLK